MSHTLRCAVASVMLSAANQIIRPKVMDKIWQREVFGSSSAGYFGRIALVIILCGWTGLIFAQRPEAFSNLRSRVVVAGQPRQALDSLTVAPPLVAVTDSATGQPLDLRIFSLHHNSLHIDTAQLRAACPDCRALRVRYRVWPYNLAARISRLDTTAIRRSNSSDAIEFDYSPYEPATKPWETGGLVSNGAYTRGISFGNSQNLVFNSNLNLQLNGKLGNDLELQAALSDNSIPLQPDGTTRQLQEFDRIFIQLKRKSTILTAGDYDLIRPSRGYFSNYFKRLQGAMLTMQYGGRQTADDRRRTEYGIKKKEESGHNGGQIPHSAFAIPHSSVPHSVFRTPHSADTLSLRLAAAVSRGKFTRQNIVGQEGNQGPYRLQGAEGERFIIVLAGTEKVYKDGQLLRRGLGDDYIIDYNLGELAFTTRQLITKDSRIIVEFEYAVQTYLRSTLAANLNWNTRRAQVYANFYAEQDSRNNGGAQDLSPVQRRSLAVAGDNLRTAFVSGIDTLAIFDPARVLYRRVDTVGCGATIPILVYSTDSDNARFAARFTEVPPGQGNYVQATTAANGRVYRWVAPDEVTCQPRGNFEPVIRLIAPEQRQLFTVGAELQPFRGTQVQAEAALSNRDLNRFSPLGNSDDLGGAGFLNVKQWLVNGRNGWLAQLNGSYEYTARTFLPLNPYRPAEFTRDWNANTTLDTVAEQLARAGLTARRKNWGEGRYEYGTFQRQGAYDGQRHFGQLRTQRRGYALFAEANLLQTDGRLEQTRFSRPKAEISKTFFFKNNRTPALVDSLTRPDSAALPSPAFKVGLYAERERNERRVPHADTLSAASFWYDLYRFYIQTPENEGVWQYGGFLSRRTDLAPVGDFFQKSTVADELNVNGRWQPPALGRRGKRRAVGQNLAWNFTYRHLRVLNPELTTQTPQSTYLGRVDYSLTAWKGALAFNTGYELGSGQSPKTEFNYVAVNPGEGQFTWVDRNRDSILQVDEMEIAVFQDQASYIRVAVTTTDYVRTNNVLLNQSLRLDPRLLWANRRGWRRTLSRFSTQSTLQINRRTYADAPVDAWNPFLIAIADTALVTVNATTRHVLFVNRAHPVWDVSMGQGDNRSQVALTTGFERRRITDWTLHGRLNLGQQWSTEGDVVRSDKSSANESFDSRNYQIGSWEAGPKLTWLPNRTFRTVVQLNWKDSHNTSPSAEKAVQTDWNAELTWNPQAKKNGQSFQAATSLRAKGTFADIRYNGQPNTAVAFTMLEGLQDGKNFLWSLNLDRQLSRSVQLSLNYEGRKTGEGRVVHVGRAQVRAVF